MATNFSFKVTATDGAARTGAIKTPRGEIRTPAFMPVGTAGTVKAMLPDSVRVGDVLATLGEVGKPLVSDARVFDRFVGGDANALSPSEQRGAKLFVGAGKCSGCHAGPFLSDQSFHNVGLAPAQVAGRLHASNTSEGDPV